MNCINAFHQSGSSMHFIDHSTFLNPNSPTYQLTNMRHYDFHWKKSTLLTLPLDGR